jgi:hypothetical protein
VLTAQARALHQTLQQVRRRFGRQGRGQGTVCVALGRQPENQLLALGAPLTEWAPAAPPRLHSAAQLSAPQRARLPTSLLAALEA